MPVLTPVVQEFEFGLDVSFRWGTVSEFLYGVLHFPVIQEFTLSAVTHNNSVNEFQYYPQSFYDYLNGV